MKQHIYTSKFPASLEATARQQAHFKADVNFAYADGYKYIKSSDKLTFQMLSSNDLVEVDVTEEQLVAAAANLRTLADTATPSNSTLIGKSQHILTGERELDGPFFDDVASCFNAGIKVIEDAEGYQYTVNSATSVTDLRPDTDDEYCINCHNIMLIDQIINNTLLQEGKLTTDSCDNMLKLVHLKQMLGDC